VVFNERTTFLRTGPAGDVKRKNFVVPILSRLAQTAALDDSRNSSNVPPANIQRKRADGIRGNEQGRLSGIISGVSERTRGESPRDAHASGPVLIGHV